MPIVSSNYTPPLFFRNGHIATIYAGLFRRVIGVVQERERLFLSDGDFLDLDWSFASKPSDKVVILLHGLEGNAQRPYITGSARIFNQSGYDACAVNFRSCSGETNRLYRSYHSGATEDLHEVVQYILGNTNYSNLYLNGFSLGGNLALKYLGERSEIPKQIKAAVAVSVPCHLHSSLVELLKPKNYLYARRFRKHLIRSLKSKQVLFPDLISDTDIKTIKTLRDFDEIYTSKAHGFKDALDYYTRCSCLRFLPRITIPSLIINAKNDSFLGPECYPYQEADTHKKLYLETPDHGGHVGFYETYDCTYTEKRGVLFLNKF